MIRFQPRKILVPFDFSAPSRLAWRHAVALAGRFGAELEFVYVEPWKMSAELMPVSRLTPAWARRLRARIRAMVGEGMKITVVEGDPAERILHLAKTRRPDLIVMGTHGRSGLSRVLLGSVAEEVMRSSPAPVLAARGPARIARAILAPVHFTSYSDHGFAYAAHAAGALGARLTALHVNVDPIWGGNPLFHLTRMINALPPSLKARCAPLVEIAGDATAGILKAAAKHDLIVLVAHEKPVLEGVLFGTTAERVLRRSKKPVLVLPPPRASSASWRALRRASLTRAVRW